MKIITALILLFAMSAGILAQDAEVKHVAAAEFQKLIDEKPGILLDVRTIREYNNAHIANSQQLNFYAPDFREKILDLPKDKPLYIYCNIGNRSAVAANFLITKGYNNVYNLHRGILEWHQAGLPLTANTNVPADTEGAMSVQEFKNIINTEKIVFFDFYAPWCAPCRMMMPMIDSLTTEYQGKIQIIKINTDTSRPLMQELNVRSIPFLVLFKNGNPVFNQTGMISRKDLEKVFQEHLD